MNFKIEISDESIRQALINKIDNLNKPKGSLRRLEELALQIGLIQQTLTPSLAILATCFSVVIMVLNVNMCLHLHAM